MRPPLHRAASITEACSLLESVDEPVLYAGGTAVQILIKQGILFADGLIDLRGIPGLDVIEEVPEGLRVGAMVSIRRMEKDPLVAARAPLAAATYGRVASPRVRNTATVGGNLAHGDYRLDPPAALLVLDARVELTSSRGTRVIAVRDFFVGFQSTAIARGEIVSALVIPDSADCSHAYVKMSSLGMNDWPAASVAALVDAGHRALRLGLGALAPVPRFVEVDITGADLDEAVDVAVRTVSPLLDPIPDIRGTASYKAALGAVATEDAVRQAWEGRRDPAG